MPKVSRISLVDTTAEVLREGMAAGRWQTKLPGEERLAKELGVSRQTLRSALARLAADGLISSSGPRKAPLILKGFPRDAKSKAGPGARHLRVVYFTLTPLSEMDSADREYTLRILMDLQGDGHQGLIVEFPKGKNPHKTGYLSKIVKETQADAWLVFEGTVEVLRWFVASGLPVLALGGRSLGLPIATTGSNLMQFIDEVVGKLTGLGHRRIVLISPERWRHPEPTRMIGEFRRKLSAASITPGEYHTPDWEETPEGLGKLLDELFRVTPPTALLCWSVHTVYGVQAWLHKRGLRIPEDVSVVSMWNDVACGWYSPGQRIARPSSISDTAYYRIVRNWVRGVAKGEISTKRTFTRMPLDEGNSIGPPKQV